jgi:hypothetical protein
MWQVIGYDHAPDICITIPHFTHSAGKFIDLLTTHIYHVAMAVYLPETVDSP